MFTLDQLAEIKLALKDRINKLDAMAKTMTGRPNLAKGIKENQAQAQQALTILNDEYMNLRGYKIGG